MSDPMDRRPERAFAPKRLVTGLLKNPDFDVTLVHYKKMTDESLYREAHEIIIPLLRLPFWSHFFSFVWFCLRTKEKFDVVQWLLPRPLPFFWLFPARKVVVIAHDGYVGHWTFANIIFWFNMAVLNIFIDAVIGVSEYGRHEIMKTYHFPEKKAFAVYNGVDSIYHPRESSEALAILKKNNIEADKYFLYVGSLHPHKNVDRLIEAYVLLRNKIKTDKKLVLVGKSSYGEKILEMIKNSKYSDDIIYAGFIPVEDLPAFYNRAFALVFVSLAEGFGIPLAEAMACGIPVITSNISAMPEVVGDAAILVNPYSSKDIMTGMEKILKDENLRKELSIKGLERSKMFTWDKYVQGNINIYKYVLNNK